MGGACAYWNIRIRNYFLRLTRSRMRYRVQIGSMIEKMAVPTNVIMAGKHVSTSSYISAIEHGAFGFVVPPIETTQVSHAVLMAAEKAADVDKLKH
jgi:DNA-binding NtrC family response regulator